jgi:hypothetical protein
VILANTVIFCVSKKKHEAKKKSGDIKNFITLFPIPIQPICDFDKIFVRQEKRTGA